MAEGFELCHVSQQSRRDKLRVILSSSSSSSSPTTQSPFPPLNFSSNPFQFQPTMSLTSTHHHQQQQQTGGLAIHFYDPTLHLDLLNCASGHGFQSSHLLHSSPLPSHRSENPSAIIKGEGQNQTTNSSSPSPSLIDSTNPQLFYGAAQNTEFGISQGLSLSPPGPFTGYTSALKGSVFLRPAQQLLQEICDVGRFCSGENLDPDPTLLDPSPVLDASSSSDDAQAKSRLISMLDEVYRKYKQCYQQVQAVVASFGSIQGLSNAAPLANVALQALSKHFRGLKTAITEQLRFVSNSPAVGISGRKHRPAHGNQPGLRPQRGLPERAVSVLRSWLFEHFLHPYPTDTDKMVLAKQTGLSRSQVSNWFINARVRIWKPMVEEIHALETHQQQQDCQQRIPPMSSSQADNPTPMANPSSSGHGDVRPDKRLRNELMDLPLTVHHTQSNMDYAHFGVSDGVSLTLALHQNSRGIHGLLDPFRYGLGPYGDGFEAQARHFGTRDVMGGQLLHDFVG